MAFVASGLIWLPLGASAFVRVAGRPAVEWAGTAAHFGARRANGQTEFRARVENPGPLGLSRCRATALRCASMSTRLRER